MSRGNTQTPDCDNMFKSQPSQSAEDHLLQEFLAQEDANDAHDVQVHKGESSAKVPFLAKEVESKILFVLDLDRCFLD